MHEVASPFDEHRNQLLGEEIANSVSHGVGVILIDHLNLILFA